MWGYLRLSRSGVLLTILVIVASVLVLGPAGAVPCFSEAFDMRSELRSRDAAIIGEFVSEVDDGGNYFTTVRVTEVLKGDVPEEIVVRSSYYPCAFQPPRDEPFGVELNQGEDGTWYGDVEDVDLLREAASPFPPPADGEPVFLLGGSFGEVGLMALDRDGRTVGYGYGSGGSLDTCPGSETVAEVSHENVGVRRISDLTRSRPLAFPEPSGSIYDTKCVGPNGRVVVAYFRTYSEGHKQFRIVRRDGSGWETLYEGRARPMQVGAQTALLARPFSVHEIDYGTGEQRRLYGNSGRIVDVARDPSGSRTAITEKLESGKDKLSVLERSNLVAEKRFKSCYYGMSVAWRGRNRLVAYRCSSAFILDDQLNTLDRIWRLRGELEFVNDEAFSTDANYLFRWSADGSEKIRTLFSSYLYDIEALPSGTVIDAPPHS